MKSLKRRPPYYGSHPSSGESHVTLRVSKPNHHSCLINLCVMPNGTVLVLSKLKKITATATQPQRNVFKYFAIFKNVAHSLEPGETPSYSASHQAPNYGQRF